MNKYVLAITLFLLFPLEKSTAQNQKSIWGVVKGLEKKADEKFKNYEYKLASSLYLKAIKKGNKDVYFKLIECYNLLNQPEKMVYWFEKAEQEGVKLKKEEELKYADALCKLGNYEKAKIKYRAYLDKQKDPIVRTKLNSLDKVDSFFKRSKYVTLEEASFNSKYSEFSPTYFQNKLLFLSNRPFETSASKFLWDDTNFLDIYQADLKTNKVSKFHSKLNSDYHEGPMTFPNENEIYFTRTNFLDGELNSSFSRVAKLNIYQSSYSKELDTWSKPNAFPHNGNEYSTGHPVFGENKEVLYFVSDRPGGYGGTDIYLSDRKDGTWSEPENLGDQINTSGNEMFPYLRNNFLFFASDGHVGLGGLDVFVVNLQDEKKRVKNLGSPINSSKDDFGLIVEENLQNGYLSTNREGGEGMDDVYAFRSEYPLGLEFIVKGKVIDSGSHLPLGSAYVLFKNTESEVEFHLTSDSLGLFEFKTFPEQNYTVLAKKNAYKDSNLNFYTELKEEKQKEWNIEIPLASKVLEKGMDLTEELDLDPIYFDFDQWDISPDASDELDKVLEVLALYPGISIELGSHTDSRGSDEYNLELSQKRAKASSDYLVQKGVSPDRIKHKGFGETALVNSCDDGDQCSKEEHELNRRTEFIVVKD